MKKRLNIIFDIIIPIMAAYATFFLLFYFYQRLFFQYRWLAIIPFIIVTGFIIKDNMREWKVIRQQD